MKTTDQTAELSAEQLAVKLGVNLESIWRYCRRGMPHFRVRQSGKKSVLRFKWSEVERWVDTQGIRGRSGIEAIADYGESVPVLPLGDPSATMLDRVRGQELASFKEWQAAIAAGRPDMEPARRFLAMTNLLVFVEKARIRSGEARREIEATIQSEVNAHIAEWSRPIRETLAAMPGKLGARANPADPACATQTLTDFVGKQLLRLLDRPIFPTAAHEIK